MDHDDPHHRIAEPLVEYDSLKPGRAWDFPRNLWNGLVMAFLVVTLGIAAVTYGAVTPYGYWVGTPAKAAVDHCEYHGISSLESSPDLDCTGTWSVHGQSQTGPIKPPFHDNEQNGIRPGKSVLDLRVHNGTAYRHCPWARSSTLHSRSAPAFSGGARFGFGKHGAHAIAARSAARAPVDDR